MSYTPPPPQPNYAEVRRVDGEVQNLKQQQAVKKQKLEAIKQQVRAAERERNQAVLRTLQNESLQLQNDLDDIARSLKEREDMLDKIKNPPRW